jgi:SAM-dependent methyltransferase
LADDRKKTGFDAHSDQYAEAWDRDPSAHLQRARVHRLLDRHVGARARVLDVGCGTGTDAAWLARRGHTVVAVDRSEGMLDQARRACQGLDVTFHHADAADLPDGPFDAALSNFGALNCVADLRPVAAALADRLRPGAPFVLVLMAHVAPAELLALSLSGHPVLGLRRRRATSARVGGAEIPVRFWRPREVHDAFSGAFTLAERVPLGLILPTPGEVGRRWRRLLPWLDPIEQLLTASPRLPAWGDHVAWVWIRASGGP